VELSTPPLMATAMGASGMYGDSAEVRHRALQRLHQGVTCSAVLPRRGKNACWRARRSGGGQMAVRTCEGATAPLEQPRRWKRRKPAEVQRE